MARLHEYQGKRLLAEAGFAIPKGQVVTSPDGVPAALKDSGLPVVIKAQAWTTSRASQGAIAFAESEEDVRAETERMLALKIAGFDVTEILIEQYGIGELQLLMPALASLCVEESAAEPVEPGWVAWVAPPFQPYPPALQKWGINLSRMLIVRPRNDSEALWSAEQALSSGTCAAVLLWPQTLDDQASRRLQLAAEKGSSWAIAFRPLTARSEPSAAALRIELSAGQRGTRLAILKSRGGSPAILHDVV